jgi:hypothetical protein
MDIHAVARTQDSGRSTSRAETNALLRLEAALSLGGYSVH